MRRIIPLSVALAAIAAIGLTAASPADIHQAASRSDRDCHARDGMVHIQAGSVLFGEDGPGRPGRKVEAKPFWIDEHEVTNRQFAEFVKATGYRTAAETQGGGAVFVRPTAVDPYGDASQWWRFSKGASWRNPEGSGAVPKAFPNMPVVQVSYEDAQAYANWAGGRLPTELEWERAARGAQDQNVEPLRWAYDAEGRPTANTWQGTFPSDNHDDDGFHGLAPVGCFPANAFGLQDMIGNAWEWTSAIRGGAGTRILKGGSFLCSLNYCSNFRPAGWQAQEQDLPTSHAGFRLVRDNAPSNLPRT